MVPSALGTFALATLLAALPAILAHGHDHQNIFQRPSAPVVKADHLRATDMNGVALPPLNTTYFFDQLIDHQNPHLGTFKQRFWMTWEFYAPGGPIVLFTPGEANAEPYTGYLTNLTINGRIAQQQHGAVVILEHRYYGQSNPFPDLQDESLRFHTIGQAVDDFAFFAKTVDLPMPGGSAVKPDQAPWVLVGGSYAGALVSWIMVAKPNVFAAGYASSAVVEAITDFWAFFELIRQKMPQNCSADIQSVIAHVDEIFTRGPPSAINAVKANFGLQNLTHLDDVGGALRRVLSDWQNLAPNLGIEGDFFKFCDALEVSNGTIAPALGFGLDHALHAWGGFWKNGYLTKLCGESSVVDCLGTHDPHNSRYTNTTVDNFLRSWMWIVCNEVGFYQAGAPEGHPTLVSRLLTPEYDAKLCTYYFPEKFKTPPVPSVDAINRVYRGWHVDIDNIFFANGRRDPWLEATVSAKASPYQVRSTRPVGLSDGFHCSDLVTSNGRVDASVAAVQNQGLAAIRAWLAEFRPVHELTKGNRIRVRSDGGE